MLSKSIVRATALGLALLSFSCARLLPWRDDQPSPEINLAFLLENNLIRLQTVRLDNQPGRYILGSAAPQTVVSPQFAGTTTIQITENETVKVTPSTLDLRGVADAIIGVDAWRNRAISIDYRSGLVTYQKQGIQTGLMKLYTYDHEPMIYVKVNGAEIAAIVDTSNPDTLLLPARTAGRGPVRVEVAGSDFGILDVQYANVPKARVGNRVLSRFLVTIDYGKKMVGLWRDPRIPIGS
jgi:hypothetical protein